MEAVFGTKHGFSDASFYTWRREFGGMEVSDAKRLKAMEHESARLKKLLAEAMLDKEVQRALTVMLEYCCWMKRWPILPEDLLDERSRTCTHGT